MLGRFDDALTRLEFLAQQVAVDRAALVTIMLARHRKMVAHLAGAMNKPTWLLLKHEPDWRWTPQSGGSEWYPSMRLYAQPAAGDWATVAAAVHRDLDELIPPRRP